MPESAIDDQLLEPRQAAEELNVSPETLRRYSRNGLIDFETTVGGHRRYSTNEIHRVKESLRAGHKLSVVKNDSQGTGNSDKNSNLDNYDDKLYPESDFNACSSGQTSGEKEIKNNSIHTMVWISLFVLITIMVWMMLGVFVVGSYDSVDGLSQKAELYKILPFVSVALILLLAVVPLFYKYCRNRGTIERFSSGFLIAIIIVAVSALVFIPSSISKHQQVNEAWAYKYSQQQLGSIGLAQEQFYNQSGFYANSLSQLGFVLGPNRYSVGQPDLEISIQFASKDQWQAESRLDNQIISSIKAEREINKVAFYPDCKISQVCQQGTWNLNENITQSLWFEDFWEPVAQKTIIDSDSSPLQRPVSIVEVSNCLANTNVPFKKTDSLWKMNCLS
jgi:DNA-binding transcriptional MerR regulator